MLPEPCLGNCQVCQREALNIRKLGLDRQCDGLRCSRLTRCERSRAPRPHASAQSDLSQVEQRAVAPAALDQRLENARASSHSPMNPKRCTQYQWRARQSRPAPSSRLRRVASRTAIDVALVLADPGASAQNIEIVVGLRRERDHAVEQCRALSTSSSSITCHKICHSRRTARCGSCRRWHPPPRDRRPATGPRLRFPARPRCGSRPDRMQPRIGREHQRLIEQHGRIVHAARMVGSAARFAQPLSTVLGSGVRRAERSSSRACAATPPRLPAAFATSASREATCLVMTDHRERPMPRRAITVHHPERIGERRVGASAFPVCGAVVHR